MRWILVALVPVLGHAQPVTGFVEGRIGNRLQSDPTQDEASIREVRMQVSHTRFLGPADVQIKADFLYDDLDHDREDVDLERGEGWVDLRTASAAFRPAMWMDLKVGRQVLTWGTGDLLFLNDMFPKDWQSFFNGRDVEYLKAPSDAVWAAMFPGDWTVDLVWTPVFDADRYLDGDGISYYPQQFSPSNPMPSDVPDGSEWAARLSRNLGSLELAFYGYEGYWKSPAGFSSEGVAVFPELRVWGASVLTPVGDGLLNLETAYYDSLEDRSGNNPGIGNSEARFLAGYTREVRKNLTLGVQGYVEWLQDYDAYTGSLPEGMPERDELRQVTTLRLTQMLMNQNLILSGFVFVSPTDRDGYFRGSVEYKWSDTLTTTLGVNAFAGDEPHTFFGQFEDNTNLYLAVRRWL
jgi:hypothetical protein